MPEMNPEQTLSDIVDAVSKKDWRKARDLAVLLRNYLQHHPDAVVHGLKGRGLRWMLACTVVGVDLFTCAE